MELQRGMREVLERHFDLREPLGITMEAAGSAVYDYCCFGVDAQDRLSDDRYMVFYNQPQSPGGELRYQAAGRSGAMFSTALTRLPPQVNKLVFTVSIDGAGTMGQSEGFTLRVSQNGAEELVFALRGSDFQDEKAIIAVEVYQKNNAWRIAAVGRGFNGGLGDLLRAYGGEEIREAKAQGNSVPQAGGRNEDSVPLAGAKKVELRKGQKVSLKKQAGEKALGEILINLNCSQPAAKGGLFSRKPKAIDLDLGCLYELQSGRRGCVQALGNAFGHLDRAPYVSLDGDDRTGAVSAGENLRVNGSKVSEIRRLLIYTFIYEGVANWQEADGVVTVQCPGSPDIIVRMDEYGSSEGMCAIAMLENTGGDTLSVEKLVRFFHSHREMDHAYNWGLRWVAGRK